MNTKCICTGPLCDCGAEGIIRDGSGVRHSVRNMDSGVSVFLSDSDNAYAEMKERDSDAWRSPPARDARGARIEAAASEVYGHAYATMKAAGHDDGTARNDAAYAEMKAREQARWA